MFGQDPHADLPIPNLVDIPEFRRLVVESLLRLPHGEWVFRFWFLRTCLGRLELCYVVLEGVLPHPSGRKTTEGFPQGYALL